MFIEITPEFSVDDESVIGIFDLDNASRSPYTRYFLRICQKADVIVAKNRDIPKSFILCDEFVCLAQTSSASLVGRANAEEKQN